MKLDFFNGLNKFFVIFCSPEQVNDLFQIAVVIWRSAQCFSHNVYRFQFILIEKKIFTACTGFLNIDSREYSFFRQMSVKHESGL